MCYDQSYMENYYINKTSSHWRKQFGQVFTPPIIARLMIHWICDRVKAGRILDPALGLGIFFRELALLNNSSSSQTTVPSSTYQCIGYEIDPSLSELLNEIITTGQIPFTYYLEDFLLTEISEPFDGIVCNPPYIHFQDYKHSLTLIQEFNQRYGLEMNGFSNIYVLFLIKALHLLKPGGRAAFIIPSEFLNADYGISIKECLLRSGALRKLIIFDPTIQLFPGFLTTSAILLFEREQVSSNTDQAESSLLDILTVSKLDDLEAVDHYLFTGGISPELKLRSYSYDQLNPGVKWKQYYSEMKIHLHLEGKPHLVPFQQFANTRRGIATGANEFFTLSLDDLNRYKIKREYVSPCLSRASQAQYALFGEREFTELAMAGKKVFLLNVCSAEADESVQAYLRFGEEQGYHTRYLTRNRQPWYSMEPVRPADLLVKTFGRMGAFFIENQSKALHLTCFHGVYFNPLGEQYKEAIFLYLLTDLAREIFEGQKREYGSGLGKFEPNDIKHAKVLDFTRIGTDDLVLLHQLYYAYCSRYRAPRQELTDLLRQAEQIFYHYW